MWPRRALEEAMRGAMGRWAVRRSSRFHCSGRCGEKGVEFYIDAFRGVDIPRTHHDLFEQASAEDFMDLLLLFFVRQRQLRHHLLGDEREHLVNIA
jgi:hypothetical protein